MGKHLLNYDTNAEFVEHEKTSIGSVIDFLLEMEYDEDYDDYIYHAERTLHMYVDEDTNTLLCATTQYCYDDGITNECYDKREVMPPRRGDWDWIDSASTPVSNVIPGDGNMVLFHTVAQYYVKRGQGWAHDYDRDYLGTFIPDGNPSTLVSARTDGEEIRLTYYTYPASLRGIFSAIEFSGDTYMYSGIAPGESLQGTVSGDYKWVSGNKAIWTDTKYPIIGSRFNYISEGRYVGAELNSAQTHTHTVQTNLVIPVELIISGENYEYDMVKLDFVEDNHWPIFNDLDAVFHGGGTDRYIGILAYKMGVNQNNIVEYVSSVKPGVAYVNETKNVYYNYYERPISVTVEYYDTDGEMILPFQTIVYSSGTISAENFFAPFIGSSHYLTRYPGLGILDKDDRYLEYYNLYSETAQTAYDWYDALENAVEIHGESSFFKLENYKIVFNSKIKNMVVRLFGASGG